MNVADRNCAVVVVGRPLEQHRADALGDAAPDLALDDGRVDQRAAVLDHDVALDLAPGRSRRRRRRSRSGCRPTSRPRRRRRWPPPRARRPRRPRTARPRPGAATSLTGIALSGYAPHGDVAVGDHEVLGAGLEQLRGEVEDLRPCSCRAPCSAAPPAIVAARLPPVKPERDDVAVADDDPDLLERHAELVGRDLGERRLVALAVRHLAGEHARRCRRPRDACACPRCPARRRGPSGAGRGRPRCNVAMPMPR